MTENKRFDCFENTWGSRTITDSGKCIGAETAVDLLNQLSEENEQLRLQLNLCSDQRNEFHRGVRENANRIGKLKKENEQLKEENELLKSDLDYFWKAYSNQEYGLDYETHIQLSSPIPSRKELLDENEQLKSEIKDLNDILARYEEKELN